MRGQAISIGECLLSGGVEEIDHFADSDPAIDMNAW
jgi:hypothetical protein